MIFFFSPYPVYRQGDIGTSWYTVLSGSLDVKVSETSCHQVGKDLKPQIQVNIKLCTVTVFI